MTDRKRITLATFGLALAGMACSLSLDLPSLRRVEMVPTITEEINIPAPSDAVAEVGLEFGAGELFLEPGATDGLIQGVATYNLEGLKPEASVRGNTVRLRTGLLEGIPDLNLDLRNRWNLALADTPMRLRITGGAFEGRFELGGLALEDLHIISGASDVEVAFSEPNRVEMERFRYDAGASEVTLIRLANANFALMVFDGGAGDYSLDFTGELRREAEVNIDVGLSALNIIVPEDMNVRVRVEGTLASVSVPDGFRQRGDEYVQAGVGPGLTIRVDLGAGDLDLRYP